ncbi:MAG: OmpA family protein [Alphaproteobacteria bacterium]|nr:OmpA family protein [Alphaproteobacteria bacterium]MDP6829744.1 OmpA family protein [Alphaproteobacteria bacterium]MDP6875507.1 OmpA family protein [Alphaproteobacteria bacterium]
MSRADKKAEISQPSKQATGGAAKQAPKRQQLAALPPSGDALLQVRFRAGSSVLTRDDEDLLKIMAEKVAPTNARLQLKAYAEGTGNDTSKARRLSLSRALAVRSYLIENGLRSTRIDVRALGIARDGGAPDRVDILLLER